jgi:hypothetical protein
MLRRTSLIRLLDLFKRVYVRKPAIALISRKTVGIVPTIQNQ